VCARNKNVFSLDLNTDSESLPMTDVGSEFQTDGVAHRKEGFAQSVRANGWMSSGVADERSVRALTRRLMRWLRYCGTVLLFFKTTWPVFSSLKLGLMNRSVAA